MQKPYGSEQEVFAEGECPCRPFLRFLWGYEVVTLLVWGSCRENEQVEGDEHAYSEIRRLPEGKATQGIGGQRRMGSPLELFSQFRGLIVTTLLIFSCRQDVFIIAVFME